MRWQKCLFRQMRESREAVFGARLVARKGDGRYDIFELVNDFEFIGGSKSFDDGIVILRHRGISAGDEAVLPP